MSNHSFSEEVVSDYIGSYLESARKINYTDLKAQDGIVSVLYKDLPNTELDGYPIASDYVCGNTVYSNDEFLKLPLEMREKCELRYHYLPCLHELYVGTTGSGKTTGCIEPQLRAISSQKNKPNLFITDPKGEIFERNVEHLSNNGYEIFLLNFKDITRSNKWNPLLEMYDKQMEYSRFGDEYEIIYDKVDTSLKRYVSLEAFEQHNYYYKFNGYAFPDSESFKFYVSCQKDYLYAQISSLVNQFATSIIKVQSLKDPSWDYGAQQLLKGIVMCMLDDASTPNSGFTKDMMTFHTIHMFYNKLRASLARRDADYTVDTHPLLRNRSNDILFNLRIAFDNAPNTMLSYCGVFDGAIKDWFQGHIFALTTGNTINLDKIGDKPFAIFVITRDYEKSDFTVAGMFIDWTYRQCLIMAENSARQNNGMPSTRPLHFLLDEFGNVPEIVDFENKIATSRSRNIWFHLVVQSYEQISVVYDDADKRKSIVICDNCNSHTFLGAQSRETKEKFSKECGTMWVPSLGSTITPNDSSLNSVSVIPISTLDGITPGDLYIKRLYMPVIKSQFIRSYVCAAKGDFKHFRTEDVYAKFAPVNLIPFNGPKYTYKPLR